MDRMMKIIIWNNLLNFNNKEVQLKKSERTLKNKQTKKMKILIFNHLWKPVSFLKMLQYHLNKQRETWILQNQLIKIFKRLKISLLEQEIWIAVVSALQKLKKDLIRKKWAALRKLEEKKLAKTCYKLPKDKIP